MKIPTMNIEELRQKILLFNAAYEKGEPLVPDYIYDFYKKQLMLQEKNTKLKISNIIGNYNNVATPHLFPILSLDHDFGTQTFQKFLTKIEKKVDPFPMIAELKIDGVSIVARYENGILIKLATRGNGKIGEDITYLKDYVNLPDTIYLKNLLEIRFEAYIEKNLLKNPRNAVAGMLLKKEISPYLKQLKFAPHNLYSHDSIWQNYEQLREIFKKMHLNPIAPHAICTNIHEMTTFFEKIQEMRKELAFEIDGVVFKINDFTKQQTLGNTATAPKFAFAIKFPNEFAISQITNINFQVSRFGKITPVAEFNEVIINNRKINNATLSNIEQLQKNGYSIGDIVQIEMAGEVIPMIACLIEKRGIECNIPISCPSCNLVLNDNTCLNSWNCKSQKIERLKHFASKHALNIEGIADKQIEFFVHEGVLNYPYDFFTLEINMFNISKNPTWLGAKYCQNLINNIEKSKYITLEKFYICLCMPHIGKSKAILLQENFPQFQDFLKASTKELEFLGKTIAKDVSQFKETEQLWIAKTYEYMKINENFKKEELMLF